jgi:hypothetical protein
VNGKKLSRNKRNWKKKKKKKKEEEEKEKKKKKKDHWPNSPPNKR